MCVCVSIYINICIYTYVTYVYVYIYMYIYISLKEVVRYTPAHPDLFGAALFQRCLGVFSTPKPLPDFCDRRCEDGKVSCVL